MRASIRRFRLGQFTKCRRSKYDAITLDESQIRGNDEFRSRERSTHINRRGFIQEPSKDCARLGV
jgi:hypothetical protein